MVSTWGCFQIFYQSRSQGPRSFWSATVPLDKATRTLGTRLIFYLSISLRGRRFKLKEKGFLGAREKWGVRALVFVSRQKLSFFFLPFQTPATHATFLSVVGSAFERCRFLSAIYFLAPYALLRGKKLALGKLLLCSVGRYVKLSTKKRFSGLMTYLKFYQVEVAAVCWRIAIVISSTAPCFRVH